MADQKVLETQQWLNETYTLGLTEDGQTGYNTVRGLIKALQTELEITADGSFGVGTKNSFNSMFPNGISKDTEANSQKIRNIIRIINGGYWCRGIEAEYNDQFAFTIATENATKILKGQLGVDDSNGVVTGIELKAILTTDAYTLQGDEKIREIQQALNQKYINILGFYIATNGIYERNTNTAIIKAIQSEIGVDVDGGWGNQTKNALPVLGPGSSRKNLVYLLQYLLYLNGFDPNGFDGGYGNGVTNAVKQFQTLYVLDADGYCGKQTWSALAVSCGDTSRSAKACDTRFEITPERAEVLKNNGYEIVGRYLTGGSFKELRLGELSVIFNAGLKAFLIYQKNNRLINDFSYSSGKQAALEASGAAMKYMVPEGTTIYFAVDLDVYEDQIDTYIIPYFRGINDYISNRYKVGIYGPRLVCSRVANNQLSQSSFVADMSTGYSCNIGQNIPNDWCYDQFSEITNFNNDFDIDKVTYNGKIPALSSINVESNSGQRNARIISFLSEAYNLAEEYHNNVGNVQYNNLLVLQYIAHNAYPSSLWNFLLDYDEQGIKYIEDHISSDERDAGIYINEINQLISLPHLAVSICSLLRPKTGIGSVDAIIADLTGWAGDLLQFAGNFEKVYTEDTKYPSRDVDLLMQLIGNEDSLGFGLEDFIQDIDVWNLYKSLKNTRINIVFNTYYALEFTDRFNGFVHNRIEYGYLPDNVNSTDSNSIIIYKLAMSYLSQNLSEMTGVIATLFELLKTEPVTDQVIKENTASAFANKVTTMI